MIHSEIFRNLKHDYYSNGVQHFKYYYLQLGQDYRTRVQNLEKE